MEVVSPKIENVLETTTTTTTNLQYQIATCYKMTNFAVNSDITSPEIKQDLKSIIEIINKITGNPESQILDVNQVSQDLLKNMGQNLLVLWYNNLKLLEDIETFPTGLLTYLQISLDLLALLAGISD